MFCRTARTPKTSTAVDTDASIFKHKPLNSSRGEIRLLKIEPGNGIVRCTVRHVVPTTNPKYTALSYMWGDPFPNGPEDDIQINSKPLRVRQNLVDFLEEMRRRKMNDEFWIDAICINQQNSEEQTHQVNRMASIYQNAHRAIYWLGKTNLQVHGGVNLNSPGLNASPQDYAAQARQTVDELKALCNEYMKDRLSSSLPQSALLIASMASNKYWNRAWIQQEVLLTQRKAVVNFGHIEIPWLYFAELCSQCSRLAFCHDFRDVWGGFDESNPIHRLLAAADSYNKSKLRFSFYEAIKKFRWTECGRRRDRIFAVRMIMTDPSRVGVDYKISDKQLFQRLCWSLRDESGGPISDDLRETLLEILEVSDGTLSWWGAASSRLGLSRPGAGPKSKEQSRGRQHRGERTKKPPESGPRRAFFEETAWRDGYAPREGERFAQRRDPSLGTCRPPTHATSWRSNNVLNTGLEKQPSKPRQKGGFWSRVKNYLRRSRLRHSKSAPGAQKDIPDRRRNASIPQRKVYVPNAHGRQCRETDRDSAKQHSWNSQEKSREFKNHFQKSEGSDFHDKHKFEEHFPMPGPDLRKESDFKRNTKSSLPKDNRKYCQAHVESISDDGFSHDEFSPKATRRSQRANTTGTNEMLTSGRKRDLLDGHLAAGPEFDGDIRPSKVRLRADPGQSSREQSTLNLIDGFHEASQPISRSNLRNHVDGPSKTFPRKNKDSLVVTVPEKISRKALTSGMEGSQRERFTVDCSKDRFGERMHSSRIEVHETKGFSAPSRNSPRSLLGEGPSKASGGSKAISRR